MHALRRIAAITLLAVIGPAGPATAAEGDEAEQRRATALASFALDDLRVPRDEILAGGPAPATRSAASTRRSSRPSRTRAGSGATPR